MPESWSNMGGSFAANLCNRADKERHRSYNGRGYYWMALSIAVVGFDGSGGTRICVHPGSGKTGVLMSLLLAERSKTREDLATAKQQFASLHELAHAPFRYGSHVDLSREFYSGPDFQRAEAQARALEFRIRFLKQRLRLLSYLIKLALLLSRVPRFTTSVVLLEKTWFRYHGNRPPRIVTAATRLSPIWGRTCSSPLAA